MRLPIPACILAIVGLPVVSVASNIEYATIWQNGHPTILGGPNSDATAINSAGQIVGESNNQATLWSNGVQTNLGFLPGDNESFAEAINNAGQIVGVSTLNGNNTHIFLWQNGVMTDLGPGFATGINDAGQIIGYSAPINGGGAFLWQGGTFFSLGQFNGELWLPFAINDAGQIVGALGGGLSGLLYQEGTFTEIPNLPGDSMGSANAISNAGLVAGDSLNGSYNAYVWGSGINNGSPINLGGTPSSAAKGINDEGEVVGFTNLSANGESAFEWVDGTMIILPSFGTFAGASAINDSGEIVGASFVPEPGSIILYAVGMALIGLHSRRRLTVASKRESQGSADLTHPRGTQ